MIPQIPSSLIFTFVVILLLLFIHKYNLLKTKYKNVIDIEALKKKKKEELQFKIQQNAEIEKLIQKNEESLKNIKLKIATYNNDLNEIDYEIPKLRFSAEDLTLDDIYNKIEKLKKSQIEMINEGNIIVIDKRKINDSANVKIPQEKNTNKIESIAQDYGLLMIKYFNSEVEFILSNIDTDNFYIIKRKIEDKFNNAMQKQFSEKESILLNSAYLNLKIKEAELRFNLSQHINKTQHHEKMKEQ